MSVTGYKKAKAKPGWMSYCYILYVPRQGGKTEESREEKISVEFEFRHF